MKRQKNNNKKKKACQGALTVAVVASKQVDAVNNGGQEEEEGGREKEKERQILAMNRRVSEHKLRIRGEVDLLLNKFLPVKLANLTRRTNISLPYFQRTVSKIPVFYECRSCLDRRAHV